jgi:hypothetical protein
MKRRGEKSTAGNSRVDQRIKKTAEERMKKTAEEKMKKTAENEEQIENKENSRE